MVDYRHTIYQKYDNIKVALDRLTVAIRNEDWPNASFYAKVLKDAAQQVRNHARAKCRAAVKAKRRAEATPPAPAGTSDAPPPGA